MNSEGRLSQLMPAILAAFFAIGSVTTLAQPAPVQVLLKEKAPLRLVEYDYGGGAREIGLNGVLEVTIHNAGTAPVIVRDLYVHSLLFANAKTGERLLLIHSCECFFVTGDEKPPKSLLERQTHRLGAGDSQHFTLEEFGCGGMWKPPPPGEYLVYYRVLPVSSEKASPPRGEPPRPVSAVIEECKKRLLSDEFWEGASTSPPLRVLLRKPVRKKIHA